LEYRHKAGYEPQNDIWIRNNRIFFRYILKLSKRIFRIPVYRDNIDQIEGVLFVKDLRHLDREEDFEWNTLMEPFFVPENKKLDNLLRISRDENPCDRS
jgi:Mg2+/Co2+ transporter CorB